MTKSHYTFEGQRLTMDEIRLHVSCLGPTSIKRHLSAGRTTARAMLSYSAPKLGGKTRRAMGTDTFLFGRG